MKPPVIKVEIIHIEGPLKGTIQECFDSIILIGRHPECQVRFPRDLTAISRKHAEIRREGNRFMAIDTSTNGTLVNGKPIKEYFLKDGDVLTISENGPKISFLTTILEDEELPPSSIQTAASVPPVEPPDKIEPERPPGRNFYPDDPVSTPEPAAPILQPPSRQEMYPDGTPDIPVQTLQKPFIIQYGAVIKSYNSLPIIIGSAPDADFTIDLSSIVGHHAQIYFKEQNYHIKDLTGRNLVTINGKAIGKEALMPPDTCISLSGKGPLFQFLGEGRFAEIETSSQTAAGQDGSGSDSSKKTRRSFWPFSKK